ncbi:MAG: right-handed parallel beta-helix repeat-containing protein [Phycisphaerales bacterium]|nr:right-handed parallel beta-helix repeat-containing protein [Phycisphaerales bacterium]
MRLIVTTLFAILALSLAASAATITVPGDYPTIQEAVDAASDGDEIIVAPGTYTSTQDGHVVNMKGKAVTLRSSNGPKVTIIDGENTRRGIACFNGETDATVIEGFTITNGNATWYDYDSDGENDSWERSGGGILCPTGNPTFSHCTITGNTAGYGGGISCWVGNPTIIGCEISGNTASSIGGGLICANSTPVITNCDISGNSARDGGGIYILAGTDNNSEPTITGCTISSNTAADDGGGIYCWGSSNPTITDCTISSNTAEYGGGILCPTGNPTITDTVLCGNTPDQAYGLWTDGGGNCIAWSCQDDDGDGLPDKCQGSTGDGIHEVPAEYATIQDAITIAGYGDTILVAPGTYTGNGDWVINTLGKPMTIRATGTPEETILDGEGLRRVVQCLGGEGSGTIIEGFTITGGWGERGGGVYCFNSNPTFTDCTIFGNIAESSGGGVCADDSSNPTLIDCSILNNTPRGIYCRSSSSPTIIGCEISGNTGSGIYCSNDSTPTITGCTISGNTGSGIYCANGSNPTISDTVLCGNTPDQAYGLWTDGGGICIAWSCQDDDGDGLPDECQGGTGDGIHEVPAEYATIQDAVDIAVYGETVLVAPGTYTSTQDGHVVDMKGKAITLRSSDGPGVTIIDGQNARRGIACFSGENNATVIEGFTITNGNGTWYDYDDDGFEDYWEDYGGGVFCYSSNPTLTDCTILGNTAGDGGGGIYCRSSSPTFTDCTISGNAADYKGGGISCSSSSPTIIGCEISGNTAEYAGGGVFCYSYGSPTIIGCEISGNTAEYAGGILCESSNPTISDCTIEGNTANYGGGIYSYSSNVTVSDCTIQNNTANYDGGGIYCYNQQWDITATITDCTISGNTSVGDGGGICSYAENLTITGCEVSSNESDTGGGIHLESFENNTLVTNCTISGNAADYKGGGISSEYDSTATITSCTITGNTADVGGGIYGWDNTLTDTTVCGNAVDQIYGSWIDDGGNTVEDECLTCPGDATGDGSVDVNDVLYVLSAWDSDDPNADFNEDGLVDVNDVLILLSHFGETCSVEAGQ